MLPHQYEKLKKGLFECGLTEATYDEYYSIWIAENGDSEQSIKDYLWHCYNLLLKVYSKKVDNPEFMFRQQRKVYCEMFQYLSFEEKNKTVAQKGINHCDLQLAALSSLTLVAEIVTPNCCTECEKTNGIKFPLIELLNKSVLPHKGCSRKGGCICCYVFTPQRDKTGKLL